MRQLIKKEAYEAPLTTKRVVTMEGNCMAASGDQIESKMNIKASSQGDGATIDWSEDSDFGVDWTKE